MDQPAKPADGSVGWTLPAWAWLLGVVALFAWQAWLTLALYGDDPWTNLCNDQPIVSGAHSQHLYLGAVGATGFKEQGRTTVIDAANLALYPKTPIFDGSRLAELFLLLGGGTYQPAAYKIGFAVLCLLAPLALLVTCRILLLGNATSLLATFLGQLIWWGPHGRAAIATGDCELYFASLAALAHVGMLIAFHRTTSVWSWLGLLVTGAMVWFLQPLLLPIALPVLLVYYLSVGARHDFLTWHIAFWWVEILAVIVNLPWLIDWADSWWLRTALPSAPSLLEHRTIGTVWNAPLWGGEANRVLAVALILSSMVGSIILNQTRERPTARLLAISSGGALILAFLGISWEPLGVVGTAALFAPALWFACIPAAHGGVWSVERLWRRGRWGTAVLGGLALVAVVAIGYWNDVSLNLLDRCRPGTPLEIGLNSQREAIVQTLISHTNNDARILWEDRKRDRQASRWPALLPTLTGRSYIGGLDPDGFIEHSSVSLMQQALEKGRSIENWTDSELMEYCRRYNIRWIAAWSPALIERCEKWQDLRKLTSLADDRTGWLFEVNRTPDFALRGKADFVAVDGAYIRLANVVPENGEVIISLHYQAGMRAFPGRVQVERAASSEDPIGFVRLRLAEPAVSVTLTWER
jgi:hypothetical protein